ncbi:DEAD/DEAH box helicase family protein [Actinoplanes sp. NPDC023714]|uniref:DEAD/DEAH box helicase family protein n=1 Tax=Actinoplanes sp. NPDC023714 TaxID=3154322 RepID=UPI0033C115CA
MTQRIVTDLLVSGTGWQALERMVMRVLLARDFEHVRLAGMSGDGGADVTATKKGRRWLFQVKRWKTRVGSAVVEETLQALHRYGADIPVIVSANGFESSVYERQRQLSAMGVPLQLWDKQKLRRQADLGEEASLVERYPDRYELRQYQRDAVERAMSELVEGRRSALVVLATGLGKTFVAGEFYRRLANLRPGAKALVLAHRNELVYQLEKAFWPMLRASQSTVVWNGYEKPDQDILQYADLVFACIDSVASYVAGGGVLHDFGVVIVDECHHIGGGDYDKVLRDLSAGEGGTFLLGLSATPWRPGGASLDQWFDRPVVDIDMVRGLREGYLANIDYRMYTDNINWDRLQNLDGQVFTPKAINRRLFIEEWDDAVVERLAETWQEQANPKAIVFCGTIDHAERMAGKINAMAFTSARVIASRSSNGTGLTPVERAQILWDFAEGRTGVLCAVDVLNEGVDVPDVNIVVFQRVTHSRRIFVQQLGRGLRLSPGKKKVIVLDFVSDIRRFAAGFELQESLQHKNSQGRVRLGNKVSFRRANSEDIKGAQFLREWLGDVAAIEAAGEDVHILRYPPAADL